MTRYFERARHFDELPHPVLVYAAINMQNAKHPSACAELPGDEDVTLHDVELISAVAEVSSARANHDLQTDCDFLAHGGNHAGAGCGAAFRESGAELNSVRAAALGGRRGFNRVKTYFQQNFAGTNLRLSYHT